MRTYHLIDIENHLGDTTWDAEAIQWVADEYRRVIPIAAQDLVSVAVGRRLVFAAADAFPGADVRVACGKDAADLELIFHEAVDWLAERFDRVVVASGDHIFAGLLASLRLAGVATVAVGRTGSLSTHIRAEADQVLVLPEPVAPVVAAPEPVAVTLDDVNEDAPLSVVRPEDVERWILDLRRSRIPARRGTPRRHRAKSSHRHAHARA